jgi:sugar diacid utilization regulator
LGFGQRRDGLAGARLSLAEAVRAVRLAGVLGRDVDFAEHWLLATVLGDAEHLDLLDTGVRVATEHPHLADTVRTFAESGFSAAATARTSNLHANSVAYRLERWQQLTGWRLDKFEGLARSVVAITLASRQP